MCKIWMCLYGQRACGQRVGDMNTGVWTGQWCERSKNCGKYVPVLALPYPLFLPEN